MKRDPVVPVLATLLALLALPATGLTPAAWGRWVPSTPAGYYALALFVCALCFLVVPPSRNLRGLRPALWLLTALPFLAFGVLGGAWQRPGGWVPVVSWFVLAALAWAFGFLRRPAIVSASAVLLLGGGAVLATAGLPSVSAPLTDPLPSADVEALVSQELPELTGPRVGVPVRLAEGGVFPLASPDVPVWLPANFAIRPGPRPHVLLLDGGSRDPERWTGLGLTLFSPAEVEISGPLDLIGFDALVVRGGAWREDDPRASVLARAIAGYVRKGGLLIGPAPGARWPSQLGKQLLGAGRGQHRGAAGVERLGLGRVVRAISREDVVDVLGGGLWVPEVASRLAEAMPPAPLRSDRFHWHDRPEGRTSQGLLLLAYLAALLALTWLVRRRAAQVAGVLLLSGAVALALVWITPRVPALHAEGLVTWLGGSAGRRHEAVVLSAGPQGYRGRVRWEGGGAFAVYGATWGPAGELFIEPGRTAWLVREDLSPGRASLGAESRAAGFTRDLLLGDVDPKRLRFGRVSALPIRVEGLGDIPAATVSYRGP